MQKAGTAVPTVALAGVLTVSAQPPQPDGTGHARPAVTTVQAARPATATLDGAVVITRPAAPDTPASPAVFASPVRYTVRPGDTLSGIAFRFYGQARAWKFLYQVNQAELANPNLIFPGQVLSIPAHLPASGGLAITTAAHPPQPVSQASGTPQGTLGCSGLEELWREAGGAPAQEVTAASIAMAESSGRQFATGSAGERGYWQINPDHGSLSTYDAFGNARAAVIISGDGTNWSPWTTFTDGAYRGRC